MPQTISQLPQKCQKADEQEEPEAAIPVPNRPRFYAEQSLTADDLNAVVPWADARLRLSRYRSGWGVVFGLGVSVKTDTADKLPALVVDNGYAVGGRGEDLIVSKPIAKSLKHYCTGGPQLCDAPTTRQQADAKARFGSLLDVSLKELVILDLKLRLHVKDVDGQMVTPCQSLVPPHLEYRRTSERCVLRLAKTTAVPPNTDPMWVNPGEELLNSFVKATKVKLDGDALQNWFKDNATKAARVRFPVDPYQQREVTLIEALKADVVKNWRELLAQQLVDRISDGAAIPPPETEPGVCLARVWLRRSDKLGCHVLAVDQTPPYRRPYGPDLPPGAIDLRPYLGAEWDANARRLKALGASQQPLSATTPRAFRKALYPKNSKPGDEGSVWYQVPGQPLKAVVFQPAEFGGKQAALRILGFIGPSGPQPNQVDDDDEETTAEADGEITETSAAHEPEVPAAEGSGGQA